MATNTDGGPYGTDTMSPGPGDKTMVFNFSRKFQHRLIRRQVNDDSVAAGAGQPNSTWSVLPIQNCSIAALKNSDWMWLNQCSVALRVLSMGVECTNWQFRSYEAQNNEIQTNTIPNNYIQVYTDTQHQLPGYDIDFLTEYSTNDRYKLADLNDCVLDQDTITLGEWTWFNNSRTEISERETLNPWNTPDAEFINQTGVFKREWQSEGHAKQWIHMGTPWQYQINAQRVLALEQHAEGNHDNQQHANYQANRTYFSTGLQDQFWGGITHNNAQTARYDNVHTVGGFDYTGDVSTKANQRIAWWSNQGDNFGARSGYDDPNGPAYNHSFETRCRDQLTGMPTPTRKPPPIILMRPTVHNALDINVDWSFWCQYTMSVECKMVSSMMRWEPIDQNGSSWSGWGNLGHWRTRAGNGQTGPAEDPCNNNMDRSLYDHGEDSTV